MNISKDVSGAGHPGEVQLLPDLQLAQHVAAQPGVQLPPGQCRPCVCGHGQPGPVLGRIAHRQPCDLAASQVTCNVTSLVAM